MASIQAVKLELAANSSWSNTTTLVAPVADDVVYAVVAVLADNTVPACALDGDAMTLEDSRLDTEWDIYLFRKVLDGAEDATDAPIVSGISGHYGGIAMYQIRPGAAGTPVLGDSAKITNLGASPGPQDIVTAALSGDMDVVLGFAIASDHGAGAQSAVSDETGDFDSTATAGEASAGDGTEFAAFAGAVVATGKSANTYQVDANAGDISGSDYFTAITYGVEVEGAAVPDTSPDFYSNYERRSLSAKELPFRLDTSLLRGVFQ